MELHPDDFAGFFRAIHGCDPFPWQQALVVRLAERSEWPDVLDLPTGSGKTAALDAAVFHLALRADAPRLPALRIALVVDRRLVVDDTFAHAQKIANALCGALRANRDANDVLKEVACRLHQLAGENAPPLIARRLRGGAPLEHDWARTPTQPTILCSTVDQIGSRLLFRGYGVSDRMKPVHAGLLGTNSLILLDEAHLSEPFRQTLGAVRGIGCAGTRMALLSATPGTTAEKPLSLTPVDRGHPILKKRLQARKPAILKSPVRGQTAAAADAFASEACAMMERLREQGVSPPGVGVVVNRVALARMICERLRRRLKEDEGIDDNGIDLLLLIGRSREVDRERIAQPLDPFRIGSSGDERSRANALFVVATQCLEVGVNLDLDGLVTQAASLDALRQRFGRLNRAGREVRAEGAILALSGDIAKKADDPVYGDRIRLTWEALDELADNGTVDFGVEALPERLREAGIDGNALAAERLDAPVVMPAYLDLWSQTSPRPAADPEVSLFLHGAERTAAGVSMVWRGDISHSDLTDASKVDLKKLSRLVPPRTAEAVEVPLSAARAWLRGDTVGDMSDAPEREAEALSAGRDRARARRAFRWAGADDPRSAVVSAEELRTGDMLVVPAVYGGCDTFGWAPDSDDLVMDVADDAAEPYWGRRCAVRIARDIVQTDAQWDRLSAVLADESIDGSDLAERLLEVLPSTGTAIEGGDVSDGAPLRDVWKPLKALQSTIDRKIVVHSPYGGGRANGAVLVAERGIEGVRAPDLAAPATEDDDVSHTSSNPVPLEEHGRRVERIAGRFARTLHLAEADDVGLAAYLHDTGKADRRFQTMLSGGDPWNRPDGPALAKSGRSRSPSAWARAGLPKGWRHEALSVRMARAHPRFAEARNPALVLWLIGSHHGWGRPLFEFLDPVPEQELIPCLDGAERRLPADESGPQSLAFDFDGADWPSLFEELKREYGIWGLAHLEALLRLADHRASEEEERTP